MYPPIRRSADRLARANRSMSGRGLLAGFFLDLLATAFEVLAGTFHGVAAADQEGGGEQGKGELPSLVLHVLSFWDEWSRLIESLGENQQDGRCRPSYPTAYIATAAMPDGQTIENCSSFDQTAVPEQCPRTALNRFIR